MAHLVETMAFTNETPWHGLGKAVPKDLSTDQFLKAAGLDWRVEKLAQYYRINGEEFKSNDVALVRDSDGRQLTTVSSDWHPVQNKEAFDFFSEFVNYGSGIDYMPAMSLETAGSLSDGEIVWALAKIDEPIEIFGHDRIDPYLLFTNFHRYGRCTDIRFTPVRVVCNNTLTLALSEKADLSVRLNHRRKFDGEIVKQTLGIASSKMKQYKTMAEYLGSKKYTNADIIEYFRTVFPLTTAKNDNTEEKTYLSKAAQMALGSLKEQPGANFAEGTWWQPFNAVTYVIDHHLGRGAETRLTSAWYGANRSKKIQALDLAAQMAEAA